jgi:RNA polymerase sigma-70 factor (ECF subfamily)
MDEPDLARLLGRVAGGDRGALRSLYQAQSVRLFGIANAILRDREAAADAMQEAFIRIGQRAGQFDPARGEAGAWLGAIVRHAALDHARRRGRETLSDDPNLGDDIVQPDALARVLTGDQHKRLHWCLATLEEKHRHGILLAFVHGLSHAQISARLHLPLGTVKSWIRRGLLQLRECVA